MSFSLTVKNKMTRIKKWGMDNSPQIKLVGGIVTSAAAVGLAIPATLQTKKDVDAAKAIVAQLKEKLDAGEITLDEFKKARNVAYLKMSLKIARNYAAPIALETGSIILETSSYKTMAKRNSALAAAYIGMKKSYDVLCDRIEDRYGEDVLYELKNDTHAEKVTETDENGKKVKTTAEVLNNENPELDCYSRLFDECNSRLWSKDPGANCDALKIAQAELNDRLKYQGYLFLNEALEALRMEQCEEGQIIGWIYDPKEPGLANCVDFGIFNKSLDEVNDQTRAFLRGQERSVIINFNVDGVIVGSNSVRKKKVAKIYNENAMDLISSRPL